MIPEFPQFKLIELTDRDEIKKITSQFLPYSDFNFTSMWSWNIVDKIAISKLNNNLVVQFTDYVTNDPFYSFIGNQKLNETSEQLLEFSIKSGAPSFLRFVPEISIQGIYNNKFEVIEDRDHFDYVYNIEELRDFHGCKFAKKRNHVNGFLQRFPQAIGKIISLKNRETAKSVLELFDKWHNLKIQNGADSGLGDLAAMKRLLEGVEIFNLVTVGVFIDEKLVAVFVNELIDSEYVLAHMMKADKSVDDGLYAFLMKKNAEILSSFNRKLFNYEQDLGIENLRIAKTRFRPQTFLKKYILRHVHKS